ncbi:MAG: hypothetical protein ACREIQ_02020, partial [Nitrospiria bacterium]
MKGRLCLLLVLALPKISLAEAPTFSKDIFPILQEKCIQCHRPGEMGPMSLSSYQEVRPWAAAIREAVLTQRMPPWYADAPRGFYSNDWRLSPEETDLMSRWVLARAPEGDPKDLPAPRQFTEGWRKGRPSLILRLPETVQIPARGSDLYPTVVLDHEFAHDTWIRSLEIRPENRRVLHHGNVEVIIPNPGRTVDWAKLREKGESKDEPTFSTKLIHVGVPGRFSFDTPASSAVLIPRGSRLRLNLHYVPSGRPETDRTAVGLYFAEGSIDKERRNLHFQTKEIRIPPNTPNHVVHGAKEVT